MSHFHGVSARNPCQYSLKLRIGKVRLLKIEEYPHRTRIHTWEFVEGSESTLPESYRWTDFGSYGIGDRHVWQYQFTHSLLTPPFCYMYVARGWANKEKMQDLYRCLKWGIEYASTEEVLFEIPLDVPRLGENLGGWDDVQVGNRQIFCTESDPLDRRWECKSVRGTEWEWWWWLRLQTFDSTGIVPPQMGSE